MYAEVGVLDFLKCGERAQLAERLLSRAQRTCYHKGIVTMGSIFFQGLQHKTFKKLINSQEVVMCPMVSASPRHPGHDRLSEVSRKFVSPKPGEAWIGFRKLIRPQPRPKRNQKETQKRRKKEKKRKKRIWLEIVQ